jgi:hypothetical protein
MVVRSLNTTIYVDDTFLGNLLANAGFEVDANRDGRTDDWNEQASVVRTALSKRSGEYALRHAASDDTSYVVSQTVAGIQGSASYTFSGWVNIPPTTDTFTFTLEVQWRNGSDMVISTSPIKTYSGATAGWNQATATMAAPAGATNAVARMVVGSLKATIDVDDFSLRP